jgi:hypothetical protein
MYVYICFYICIILFEHTYRRSSRGQDFLLEGMGPGTGPVLGDGGVDAEHAYKKIKLVLDFSALPRVTHKLNSVL